MYKIKNNYLNEENLNKHIYILQKNNLLISFFFIWYFEWIYIFDYLKIFSKKSFLFFPQKLPIFLIICFIYFIYVWGISVWRRTQHGKFTRGDRKLWYKGFASFWVVELSTVLGLFIAACWMNWGPLPLFPRTFYMPRKGFLIEITIFTYIIWILYILRFTIKWNKWQTQKLLVFLIMIFVIYLIWRDILLLFGRESITLKNSSRWKYLTITNIIYSFTPEWWINHCINKNKFNLNLNYITLSKYLKEIDNLNYITPFKLNNTLLNREKFFFFSILKIYPVSLQKFKFIPLNSMYQNYNYDFLNNWRVKQVSILSYSLESFKFYPRKIGYQSKKIAMWTLLLILKMWHHLMLFIWWFFYLIRLESKKKNSYSFLSICYFNIYCCFLISLLIFLFSYLPWFEQIFKITKTKNNMKNSLKTQQRFHESIEYIYYLFVYFFYKSKISNSFHSLKKINIQYFKNYMNNSLQNNYYGIFKEEYHQHLNFKFISKKNLIKEYSLIDSEIISNFFPFIYRIYLYIQKKTFLNNDYLLFIIVM